MNGLDLFSGIGGLRPATETIPYASRTGTRTTLAALRGAGWRLMLSPEGVLRTEGFPYCLDNGAWTAFVQNRPWDSARFIDALRRFGPQADFVVVPDIVMGGDESLQRSRLWLPHVLRHTRLGLLAVQNGMTPDLVRSMIGARVGIFVGGDTPWKERTMFTWAQLARECGSYCHVGRVNTARRVRLCQMAGVDSFDGSGVSRFGKHLDVMERALSQAAFPFRSKTSTEPT